jgi:hypothetical protein
VCSYKGIYFAAASFIFLLILGTPGAAFGTTITPTSMENVGVYLVITISVRVDIVYK